MPPQLTFQTIRPEERNIDSLKEKYIAMKSLDDNGERKKDTTKRLNEKQESPLKYFTVV